MYWHGLNISCWTDLEDAVRQHRPVVRSDDGLILTVRSASGRQVETHEEMVGRPIDGRAREKALPVQVESTVVRGKYQRTEIARVLYGTDEIQI